MIKKSAGRYAVSGPLAQNAPQANIDAERAKWRSGAGKIRALPLLTSRAKAAASATFAAMRPAASYFTYFWFSHRLAAGEANA